MSIISPASRTFSPSPANIAPGAYIYDDILPSQMTGRDSSVFERAYLDHFSRVRGFLRVYLGNAAAVDDVAQDTFLQLWLHPSRFDPARSSLKTYLLGIARKKAADWWRHSQPNVEAGPQQVFESQGESLALQDALARLDPHLRNVLWLREAEGYSYEELAGILDIPLGTVKSRLFAAREELRRIWHRRVSEEHI
jgi:RNA polymerase sigma-70 factor (ECF subfamily)